MKQIKHILLGLCLITILSACGKEAEKTYTKAELAQMSQEEVEELIGRDLESLLKNSKNKEEATVISDTDTAKAESLSDNASDSASSEETTSNAQQEILDAKWYSGKLQFRDMIIQFPTTIQELSALGFEYKNTDGYIDGYPYSRDEKIPLSFYLNGKQVFTTIIRNPLRESRTLSELITEANPQIHYISFYGVEDYSSEDIYYPGGLQIGDPIDLITERLGTPSEVSDTTITYGGHIYSDFNCSLTFYVNANTQTIENISSSVNMSPIVLDSDNMENTTFNHIYCRPDESYHSLTVNTMPNSYFNSSASHLGAFFLLDEQVYSYLIQISAYTSLNEDLSGTVLFSETDENGVTKTLVNGSDSLHYAIQSGKYVFYGYIQLSNHSNPADTSVYQNEEILNAMTALIKTMQFNKMQ